MDTAPVVDTPQKRSLLTRVREFVVDHTFTALLFIAVLIAFIVFSTVGQETKTFDSFNAQLLEYYTKGSLYYGMFSGIFTFFIIIIAMKQKFLPKSSFGSEQNFGFSENATNKGYLSKIAAQIFNKKEGLSSVKSMLYIFLSITLACLSYNFSMMIAYSHMNMDTENIPSWVFPMTSGLLVVFALVIFLIHTISSAPESSPSA